MMNTPSLTTLKIKKMGLLGLILSSGLLTAAMAGAWWFWYTKTLSGEPTGWTPEAGTLGALVLLDSSIVFSAAISEFVLLLALFLFVAPLHWWVESAFLPATPASAMQWLINKMQPVAQPAAENAATPAGQQPGIQQAAAQPGPGVQQPGVQQPGIQQPSVQQAGQPQPQGQAGQQPGQQPQPQAQQQPGQPQQDPNAQPQVAQQPGQPQASQPGQPGQQPQAQPGEDQAAGQTAAQLLAQQAVIDTEDEVGDALSSLGDVKDLLASFEVEEVLDPWLAELCAILPEVDVHDLSRSTRQMAHTMTTQRSHYSAPTPVRA